MSHRQKAEQIARRFKLRDETFNEVLVEQIEAALQDAFDLGYTAAGGSIQRIAPNTKG